MVRIHNRILLSYKKEWIWVNSSEVDETRDTEWSKSEGEKQIMYINTYKWNLEKWYWWTYFQGRNGELTYRECTCGCNAQGGESGKNGESSISKYTRPCVK